MNEPMIVELAIRRGRTLDQPDLPAHLTAQSAWQAWTPLEDLLELPREAEELIDSASAALGHFSPAGRQRRHAWECAQAAAWGLTHPLPRPLPPDGFRWTGRRRSRVRQALAALSALRDARKRR